MFELVRLQFTLLLNDDELELVAGGVALELPSDSGSSPLVPELLVRPVCLALLLVVEVVRIDGDPVERGVACHEALPRLVCALRAVNGVKPLGKRTCSEGGHDKDANRVPGHFKR